MKVFSLLFAAIFAALISKAANPDSLVLHYTFDSDNGKKVIDHSKYKNNGLNQFGVYKKEVMGCNGVMSFDGSKARIEVKSKDLQLKGDFTYSFRMRLNRKDWQGEGKKSGICDIFSSGYYKFCLNNYNVMFVGHRLHDKKWQSMVVPVDRDIMGTDWSLVTIVVEYPRIRFYRNGALIKDAWMPFDLASALEKNGKVYIGAANNGNTFVDIDELMIFNRALDSKEVECLAKGKELKDIPLAEIMIEPYWYENKLNLRLNAYNKFLNADKAVITLKSFDTKPQVVEAKCYFSRSSGKKRLLAVGSFPIKPLIGKVFSAEIILLSKDGKEIATINKEFMLKKPDWVYNNLGVSDKVPKPWTPVKVKKGTNGVDVLVWGRRYTFQGTPLFSQVNSKKAEMLYEPMQIVGSSKRITSDIAQADTASSDIIWTHEKTDILKSTDKAVCIRQLFSADGINMDISSDIEYDGFCKVNLQIKAAEDIELAKLFLEIPVKAQNALYAYAHNIRPPQKVMVNGQSRTDYSKMNQSGHLNKDLDCPFSCEVHLGDDERILAFQAESPENWNNKDEKRVIQLINNVDYKLMRFRFIDQPTTLKKGESLTFVFALYATPMKPMGRTSWDLRAARSEPYGYDLDWPDRQFEGKPALANLKKMGTRSITLLQGNIQNPYPMPLGNKWFTQQVKRTVQAFHDYGINNYTYLVHQRFSAIVPEFEFNADNMAVYPFTYYGQRGYPPATKRVGEAPKIAYGCDSAVAFDACPASQALQDANVYSLYKRLQYFGEDGAYLDGTGSYNWNCLNIGHGCGYKGRDGKMHPSRPIFGVRKYLQRLYNVIKGFNQNNIVFLHDSFGTNTSTLAYGDILLTGERWHHLNVVAGTHYVAQLVPPDIFRHEFTGRQHNIALDLAAYRLGDFRKVTANSLLYDVHVQYGASGYAHEVERLDQVGNTSHHRFDGGAQLFNLIYKVRDKFDTKHAKRILYYEGAEKYVRIDPKNKLCDATVFIHPKNGVLAFVTNLSRQTQTVSLQFNLKNSGFSGASLKLKDMMNQKDLVISPEGKTSLTLKSEEWTYLWLREVD